MIIQYLEYADAASMTYSSKDIGLFVQKNLRLLFKKHKGVELTLEYSNNKINKMYRWFGTYPDADLDAGHHDHFYEGNDAIKPNTRTLLPHTDWIAVYLQFLTEGKPCNDSNLFEWQKAGERVWTDEKVKIAVDYTYIFDFIQKHIYFGNKGEPRGVKRHLAEGLYIRFSFPALPDTLLIYQFTDPYTAEVYTMDLREYRVRLKYGFEKPDMLIFSPVSWKSSHPKYTLWSNGTWEFAYINQEKKVKKLHSEDSNVKVSTFPLTDTANDENKNQKKKRGKNK
jgi:hypothetical protein